MQSNCEITGLIYVIKYKERDDPNSRDLIMGLCDQGDHCITFADHSAIDKVVISDYVVFVI